MKKYYGQNLEDKIIDELFPAEIETVLDLGANGIELSNSYFFISRGASAVLVEPSPKAFKNLSDIYFDKYKNVSLFNVAIGAENGEVPFFESGEHLGNNDVALLSTIKEGELKRWEGTNNTFQKITTQVWDFQKLMDYSPLKTFDLISIDCEGVDIDILKQMDLAQLKCKCLIIEWNSIEKVKEEIIDIVSKFGMRLHHQNNENLIFVK